MGKRMVCGGVTELLSESTKVEELLSRALGGVSGRAGRRLPLARASRLPHASRSPGLLLRRLPCGAHDGGRLGRASATSHSLLAQHA